jgi:hypothetical protein
MTLRESIQLAISEDHDQGCIQGGQGQNNDECVDEDHPDEERKPLHGHARRPQLEHGHNQVEAR